MVGRRATSQEPTPPNPSLLRLIALWRKNRQPDGRFIEKAVRKPPETRG